MTIGTPDDSYYQGSTQTTTVRVADDQEVTNSITAADPAFQDIIAGIKQAIAAAGSNNTAGLQNAETLVGNGFNGVTALGSTVNANVVNITNLNKQSALLQASLQSVTQGLTQSDVVSLTTKAAQDQTVLEASYETYARISSLTLASYLQG